MGMRGSCPLLVGFGVTLSLVLLLQPPVLAAAQLNSALGSSLRSQRVISGLDLPSAAAFLPDGQMVIAQLGGQILLWDGAGRPQPVATLEVEMDGERGLLGLAVDPQFAQSGRLYLYYSIAGQQRVGYAVLATDAATLGPVTDLVVGLAADRDHNGGALAFGPDGLLYFGTGDSGCSRSRPPGDGENYLGSCLTRLEGKVSRIDRDGGVPASNPLVGASDVTACPVGSSCDDVRRALDPQIKAAPRPEIYNWGLRNPWRFAFDERTGYLWIGDVGEVTWEEITVSTGPGQHHGWPWREGVRGASNYSCAEWTPSSSDCVEPAFAYSHFEEPADGQGAVVGGVFTNHCSWPAPFAGSYWFGDFTKNRIWMLSLNSARDGVVGERTLLVEGADGPVQFLTGPDGTLYYLAHLSGELWALRPDQPLDCAVIPPSTVGGKASAAGLPSAALPAAARPPAALPTAARPLDAPGCGCVAHAAQAPPAGLLLALIALFTRLRRENSRSLCLPSPSESARSHA